MKNLLLIISLLVGQAVFAVKLNKSASQLKWTGTKVTGKHYGTVAIKDADLTGVAGQIQRGYIVADLSKIKISDLDGKWANKFIGHIQSADFFNIEKHPTAKYEIEKVENGYFYGKLTIKGNTHKEKVKYKKDGNSYTGTLVFNRTKYDMKYGSGSFFKGLGDKMIHDDVKLEFKLVLN